MSVLVEGLTTHDSAQALDLLKMAIWSENHTGYMHESVDPDEPQTFSRPWFAWANALLAELILRRLPDLCASPPLGPERDEVPPLGTRLRGQKLA